MEHRLGKKTTHGPLDSKSVLSSLLATYSDEELEFLRAVQQLKKRSPHPTWNQVFAMVLELGYRKP